MLYLHKQELIYSKAVKAEDLKPWTMAARWDCNEQVQKAHEVNTASKSVRTQEIVPTNWTVHTFNNASQLTRFLNMNRPKRKWNYYSLKKRHLF
jgi:hypothetical protein